MAKINDIKNIIGAKARPVLEVTAGATALKEEQKIIPIPVKEVPPVPKHESLDDFLATLIRGVDYGNLPHVQGDVLFKGGALKILRFLKLKYSIILLDKTVSASDKFISYTVKVDIINQDGEIVYESIGAANSLESKFEKAGFSSDNLICRMASKRALVAAVKEMIA
ncbi:putative uncharacterized protein [Phascolarctobacterium sp. CAG:266]|nr:putative uncharacterized protein [Phascolarctobacterium sp. CAG:266]